MAAVTVTWYDAGREKITVQRFEGPPEAAWFQIGYELDEVPPQGLPTGDEG